MTVKLFQSGESETTKPLVPMTAVEHCTSSFIVINRKNTNKKFSSLVITSSKV